MKKSICTTALTVGFALVAAGVASPARDSAHRALQASSHTLLVDAEAGRLGTLDLAAPLSTWLSTLGARGTIDLRRGSSTEVARVLYTGSFLTPAGDHLGTPFDLFLRHWARERPTVSGYVRNEQLVELNVVVGKAVFAFDRRGLLRAVAIPSTGGTAASCLISSACSATRVALGTPR